MSKKLHYIYDPYCSWCYAISSFVHYAHDQGVEVVLHGGGMITGERIAPPSVALRKLLKDNQPAISTLAGVPFSDRYYQMLDQQWVMNSAPPTAAVVAAELAAGKGLEMLSAIQVAQFQTGLPIAEPSTLHRIAADLALNIEAFNSAYTHLLDGAITAHFAESRALMSQFDAKGFPTLLVEDDGNIRSIITQRVYGNQACWGEILGLS